MSQWPLSMSQGGRLSRTLSFANDDGTPINTAGWTWRARLAGMGIQRPVPISSPVSGTAVFVVDPALSSSLAPGVYDLFVDWNDAAGNPPEEELTTTLTVRPGGAE